jgi:hypothetical protein
MGFARRGADREPVRIEHVTCTHETEKALLVIVDDDDTNEIWIPKSQVDDDSEVWKKGDEGVLVIPAWLAEAKGLD